jgi:hypothetical protein
MKYTCQKEPERYQGRTGFDMIITSSDVRKLSAAVAVLDK